MSYSLFKVVHRSAPDYLTDKVPVCEDVDSLRFTRVTVVPDELRLVATVPETLQC